MQSAAHTNDENAMARARPRAYKPLGDHGAVKHGERISTSTFSSFLKPPSNIIKPGHQSFKRPALGNITNKSTVTLNKKNILETQKLARREEVIRRSSIGTPNGLSPATPGLSNQISSVKIEPIKIEPILEPEDEFDIDSEDKGNERSCWQYAADIHKYYFEVEKHRSASPSYMLDQVDVNSKMRSILVDWLVDVHYKYNLLEQTLHIAVNLIDRHLEKNLTIPRARLQLVGITALFIASKYEEIYPPEAKDFVKITDNAYSLAELFKMEDELLSSIGYRVTMPTSFQFMNRFLKASRTTDIKVQLYANYLVDRMLQEYKMLRYPPSMIAATGVYLARVQMEQYPLWSPCVEHHSTYSVAAMRACIRDMQEVMSTTMSGVSKSSKLTAVTRKFAKDKLLGVSKCPIRFTVEST
ncbi:Aste57867_15272 [Aphanomyces stellatus]|uniref:Aste57867_15272 protein n=1 Tax=Aphanomyces stellatus TaxID=120398 RepID=A0A485L5M8_9STRA|nr:hypothetical protein As57867_015216 [Aphanomyces stellatus]VFT92081.1 Aste57867_15272 [Aphanomyces stellatus]